MQTLPPPTYNTEPVAIIVPINGNASRDNGVHTNTYPINNEPKDQPSPIIAPIIHEDMLQDAIEQTGIPRETVYRALAEITKRTVLVETRNNADETILSASGTVLEDGTTLITADHALDGSPTSIVLRSSSQTTRAPINQQSLHNWSGQRAVLEIPSDGLKYDGNPDIACVGQQKDCTGTNSPFNMQSSEEADAIYVFAGAPFGHTSNRALTIYNLGSRTTGIINTAGIQTLSSTDSTDAPDRIYIPISDGFQGFELENGLKGASGGGLWKITKEGTTQVGVLEGYEYYTASANTVKAFYFSKLPPNGFPPALPFSDIATGNWDLWESGNYQKSTSTGGIPPTQTTLTIVSANGRTSQTITISETEQSQEPSPCPEPAFMYGDDAKGVCVIAIQDKHVYFAFPPNYPDIDLREFANILVNLHTSKIQEFIAPHPRGISLSARVQKDQINPIEMCVDEFDGKCVSVSSKLIDALNAGEITSKEIEFAITRYIIETTDSIELTNTNDELPDTATFQYTLATRMANYDPLCCTLPTQNLQDLIELGILPELINSQKVAYLQWLFDNIETTGINVNDLAQFAEETALQEGRISLTVEQIEALAKQNQNMLGSVFGTRIAFAYNVLLAEAGFDGFEQNPYLSLMTRQIISQQQTLQFSGIGTQAMQINQSAYGTPINIISDVERGSINLSVTNGMILGVDKKTGQINFSRRLYGQGDGLYIVFSGEQGSTFIAQHLPQP